MPWTDPSLAPSDAAQAEEGAHLTRAPGMPSARARGDKEERPRSSGVGGPGRATGTGSSVASARMGCAAASAPCPSRATDAQKSVAATASNHRVSEIYTYIYTLLIFAVFSWFLLDDGTVPPASGTILVMLDVKVQLITGEPSWFHPPFPASLANGSKVGAEGWATDWHQQNYVLIKDTLEVVVEPNTSEFADKTKIFGAPTAFETSQRQAIMPMRSTERPTGKFSTMIISTLGTTVPPGAPAPEADARSRADKVGKISQPLCNNKTKLSNRPQFDWCIVSPALHSALAITS
ncbi:hypothetical protein THAOC_25698 [Thalassiosira oceanica]|uniref:Uncharacterized protein n=1 Tax=Thalassiosira oceanica TaxID=159749 RepID=K0RNK3_THAOC|nr:hypothetical protein THAOC_25698 [Thalassiosira oceanica]|eukprot:EJK54655.1 hypothetical protein THAOC_25698 [Thalassiosira oceanica]